MTKNVDKHYVNEEIPFLITRHKHLGHMEKVVPFIVGLYFIQCLIIFKVASNHFSTISLSILGVCLAAMIGGLIFYDIHQKVMVFEKELHLSFLGRKKIISFNDIWSIEISDPGESFSSVYFKTNQGKVTIYFIDDAEKIKKFIEGHKNDFSMAA